MRRDKVRGEQSEREREWEKRSEAREGEKEKEKGIKERECKLITFPGMGENE